MIKNKGGSIVYISSSSAVDGNEGRSAYASAKAAIIAQAKVLSRELGVHNIRVNSIAPGLTNTDMMKKNHKEQLRACARYVRSHNIQARSSVLL